VDFLPREKLLIGAHQFSLTDGGTGLESFEFDGPMPEAERFHSEGDGPRTDKDRLAPLAKERKDSPSEPSDRTLQEQTLLRGEDACPRFQDNAAGLP
jgi:hypothetical protein